MSTNDTLCETFVTFIHINYKKKKRRERNNWPLFISNHDKYHKNIAIIDREISLINQNNKLPYERNSIN